MQARYQLMPELTSQEFTELKASISQNGVLVAVEYDEDGNILDGHHRVQACRVLGITDWPKIVKVGMTETEKRQYARTVNVTRRHLTQAQRQELIRQQLVETPEKSDRQIAAGLGVSHHTVNSQRRELESGGQIAQVTTTTGADGKIYPRQIERKSDPDELTDHDIQDDDLTQCDLCRSAHPFCMECCAKCTDQCNIQQTCRLPKNMPTIEKPNPKQPLSAAGILSVLDFAPAPPPITLYNPTKTEIEIVKDARERDKLPQRDQESPAYQAKMAEFEKETQHENIRRDIERAFFQICDRTLFLGTDYPLIIRYLLENPNRTSESIIEDLSECIEKLQLLKAAAFQSKSIRVVK